MTSKTTTVTQVREELERFPDYPPRDDMQNWLYLYDTSVITSLAIHYADQPDVIVASEVPVGSSLPVRDDARIPDLMFVRGGNRELMEEQRGYAIDRQGKAPDFVLEVASPTTGRVDCTDKREDYERFGVGEYWRFDPSGGEYHDAALAGDRLVNGVYEPIEIEELGEGRLRGYSEALGLYVCWEDRILRFFDPVTEQYLSSHEEERAGRMAAETRAREEAVTRGTAEVRAEAAEGRAKTAEARVAELEEELRRLRGR
ncbi:MAG: Uma2 family endonuclease [Chloroflexi bacterium]|nr:Uma2 family endonuclease [Chloroflexota bacterium]